MSTRPEVPQVDPRGGGGDSPRALRPHRLTLLHTVGVSGSVALGQTDDAQYGYGPRSCLGGCMKTVGRSEVEEVKAMMKELGCNSECFIA